MNKVTKKNDNVAGKAGPGRPKGSVNKTTAILKDAILAAAAEAGGEDGLVGYLKTQATQTPASFLPLLGKVLPMQLSGTGEQGQHILKIVTGVPRGND